MHGSSTRSCTPRSFFCATLAFQEKHAVGSPPYPIPAHPPPDTAASILTRFVIDVPVVLPKGDGEV